MAWKKEFTIVEKENLHLTLINHFHSMCMISLIFVIPFFFFLPIIYCQPFVQRFILFCFGMFKNKYVFNQKETKGRNDPC
jgi:hypothetical protein